MKAMVTDRKMSRDTFKILEHGFMGKDNEGIVNIVVETAKILPEQP